MPLRFISGWMTGWFPIGASEACRRRPSRHFGNSLIKKVWTLRSLYGASASLLPRPPLPMHPNKPGSRSNEPSVQRIAWRGVGEGAQSGTQNRTLRPTRGRLGDSRDRADSVVVWVCWGFFIVGELETRRVRASNFRGDKSVTKKIRSSGERILFRDLARFAQRRKTEQFLADRTGSDPRTAKRWLSRKSRAPAQAVYAVLADIFARIE